MTAPPPCPACGSAYVYEDGPLYVCPECAREWPKDAAEVAPEPPAEPVITDAGGTPLADGDTVTVVKDLKVKGSSAVVEVGTKVKNIRLTGGDHDIDCEILGFGQMSLKSAFVRKA